MSKTIEMLDILTAALLEPEVETSTILKPVNAAKLPKTTKTKAKKNKTDWKLAVLIPDTQIGFRRYEDGTLDPFHDVQAINLAMQVTATLDAEYGVDKVINLGDTIDLPMFGKYAQENAFYNTVNESMKATHDFLAGERLAAPNAEIVYIEGNHDCRATRYMNLNAQAASGMTQVGGTYPVTSLPHLLHFDQLGVTYVDGYPADKFWINERLVARHGTRANSNGSTSAQYVAKNPLHTTIFGHSHRMDLLYKTHDTFSGPVQNGAYSPGCLCRIDGAVPSALGGIKANEKPVPQYENWQQGMGVVWYKDAGDFKGANDFTIENIHIMDGWAVYAGTEFRATT
jgi:predicted phosphodiesterase